MRYLSLCSGIEAATVAWHHLGWTPVAFSEIEPFPAAVLKHHYPNVPNLGDMTKINGADFRGRIDLLVGGTPCQAFSVAGLRKGLSDARGNLTLTFVEIANASAPSVVLWENVPGVYSSKDNAFGCFLAGLAGEDVPLLPPGGKWTDAGYVSGPQRNVAWRTLDAQYFGLAQRRRRCFVVACPRGGADPRAVLFELEGVQRHSAPSREAGQGAAAHASAGAGGRCDLGIAGTLGAGDGNRGWRNDLDQGAFIPVAHPDVSPPLMCGGGNPASHSARSGHSKDAVLCVTGQVTHALKAEGADASGTASGRLDFETETFAAVGALSCNTGPNGHDAGNFACNQAVDAGHILPIAFHPTQDPISSTDGSTHALGCGSKGGTATCAVAIGFNGDQSEKTRSMGEVVEQAPTLRRDGPAHVAAQLYSIMPQNSGKDYKARPVDVAPPLMAGGPVGGNQGGDVLLAFDTTQVSSPANYSNPKPGDPCHPLAAGAHAPAVAFPIQECHVSRANLKGTGTGLGGEDDPMFTLQSAQPHGVATHMQVRRLTPRECERLQGFPDDYTLIPWKNKPAEVCPDGPRYKALGNSMAVTCMRWLGERIDKYGR